MKKPVCLILCILFFVKISNGQYWSITELSSMPVAISNNAVAQATVNGIMHVFSFSGIDSTKTWSGISNKSFRYNVLSDTWDTIAPLPDTQTKIASSASNVNNKIYIIGGYTVLSNGNEISSNKVHIYNPDSNVYLPDGANIPIPIDDHVQAVWKDSLIFVITGWSNSTNRPEVQIYNPSLNVWSTGSSVPNNNIYKSFGASGLIRGDTIYYYGGASLSGAFNIQNHLRMGIINPFDPTQIAWSNPISFANEPGYRCAATFGSSGRLFWIGGSKHTYNYNGIAYNGSGGVSPANRSLVVPTDFLQGWFTQGIVLPMDLRGIAEIENQFGVKRIIAGGMEANQMVSNKTLLLEEVFTPGINEIDHHAILVYPNPVIDVLYLDLSKIKSEKFALTIYDGNCRVVQKHFSSILNNKLEVTELDKGIYFVVLNTKDNYYRAKFVKE